MAKFNQTYSMDDKTIEQLEELKEYTGLSKSALVNMAIKILHKREVKK